MVSVTASVNITGVSFSPDQDTFYSSYPGNNIVHLTVTTTSDATVSSVTADFSQLGPCANQSNPINLVNSGGNTWTGQCDVTAAALSIPTNSFKIGLVIINAVDSNNVTATPSTLTIALYNLTIPSGDNCYRFATGSTDFSQVTNFNSMDITLIVEANGDVSCVTQGFAWGSNNWITVGKLKFNNVNFNNNAVDAQKLTQLSTIAKFKFTSSKTYQGSRVSVDTAQLPELNVNTFTVDMYHLSFISQGAIISDNNVQAGSITWIPKGLDTTFNTTTYDLSFTATSGFTGYTITDALPPAINIVSPTSNINSNASTVLANVTINGTGTEVSQATFLINGAQVASLANCTAGSSPEFYTCVFNLPSSEGNYNFSVVASDYGTSGNTVSQNVSYVLQTGAPSLVVTSPVAGTYYGTNGSMLQISFSAIDGNGIGSCIYSLTGTNVLLSNIAIPNCSNSMNVQLYLASGSYVMNLSATDTLGLKNTTGISFTVSDDVAPIVSGNSPTPNSSSAILSVLTDENATCKYDSVDTTYSSMGYSFNDNITMHTASVALSTLGKVYDYYIRCVDMSGKSNTVSLHVTLSYGNTTTANTTVAVNTSLPKVDPSQTFNVGSISIGTKILSVSNNGIPVMDILLTTNKFVSDVSIVVTATTAPSTYYSEKVYKYIRFDHGTLDDASLNGVKIKIRVEKTWLASNNINKSDIVLLRYTNAWTPLNTTLNSEDDMYVYYLADSPGLSLFAISKKTPAIVAATTTVLGSTANNASNNTANKNNTAANLLDTSNRHFNWTWVIILSILVFIIIVLFVLVQRSEKNSPPPIFPEERTLFGRLKRLFK